MLSSDLPPCFQFQIQMQHSSYGTLTSLPPFFVSLALSSWLTSFPPSCLSISSRPSLKLLFQFSKHFEANASCENLLSRETEHFFFPPPLYISLYSVINAQPLSPHLALLISLHFFLDWMHCSCLKNWFVDRGEVNLLWPAIPSWAPQSLDFCLS